jgi:hypothetical protein
VTRSDAQAVLAALAARRPAPPPLEEIADGHAPQLELMQARERRVLALCSRRAGKSNGIVGLMAHDAVKADGTQIYFGATKPAVRLSIWLKIWRPFCDKWKLPVEHNETMMVSRFSSGAIVAFTGTDDVRHVETYLGNKLHRAVIDEAQSQPPSVLKPLVVSILPPALSDTGGQLLVAGTIPEVPAGTFYDLWTTATGWRKLNWSRFSNPHMGTQAHQEAELALFLETSGLDAGDPLVRRDWFGEFVFDPSATGYRYDRARNGYVHIHADWAKGIIPPSGRLIAAVPHDGISRFSVAIDPGSSDRCSVQVWGWGEGTREVQHIVDWSSERNARLTWGQIVYPVCAAIQEHLDPEAWFYDAGSSQNELDTFANDYGIPVIKAANKSDFPGQVRRNNDLLQKGLIQVMQGSTLEEDYQKARFDPDARARGQWRWASQWHPDPSEAARYALQGYYAAYVEPEAPRSPEEIDRERAELAERRKRARMSAHVLEEDEDARWDESDLD